MTEVCKVDYKTDSDIRLCPTHGAPAGMPNVVWAEIRARFTGKPYAGQQPLLNLSGTQLWLLSSICLIAATAANLTIVSATPNLGYWSLLAIPTSFYLTILTTGALRAQHVVFGHYAIHSKIFGSRRLNRIGANIMTAIPIVQNADEYRSDHREAHHIGSIFTTAHDPDADFLLKLGFKPGIKKHEAWWLLIYTMFSPSFHTVLIWKRLKSALFMSTWLHKAILCVWLTCLIYTSSHNPWWVFAIAVLLSLIPLYHISALLQLLSEHRWLVTHEGPGTIENGSLEQKRKAYAERCIGRFSGDSYPSDEISGIQLIVEWIGWGLRLALIHAPVRWGGWVGDLPAHDWHHVVNDFTNWPNAIFERQRLIDKEDKYKLAEREAWGILAALDWVFEGLEKAEQ